MVNIVEMHAKPGRKDALVDFCRAWMPSAVAAGCARVELLADLRDANTVVLVEHWPSPEQLEAFMKTEFANGAQLAKFRELSKDELPALRQLSSLVVLGA